ncbi:rhodanese-related sulfurtransferase [Cupriavidus sp. AU9028]|uniref:rhodanese-related sulfurtransferase n=1 Tax=Cupriavidus sp. AU9028 TaxID=2871157 RepID=UPI001C97E215|nr:rhodanese-related sulfurtransferase [Cupriavidus sp. AU9028]MBY4899098.1 rhodanese-related sulfurtransferase [Cupriavidus sp. AU9028]
MTASALPPSTVSAHPVLPALTVRQYLAERREIALIDVREEDPFAHGHPLWAANLPLSRLELLAWTRIPRRDTVVVVYGEHDGIDLAPRAAQVLAGLGYTAVHLLEGGLQGWIDSGGELFIDVNVPSKAFGELVEARRHTPSLEAKQVKALLDSQADVVVVDARRFDEFQTMSIPTATSVPGGELVLRVRELAPDPATTVIVNCAGRTRSIIGTQSLINAGLPNPVAALRNGTIGWTLAGQQLDRGASRQAPEAVGEDNRARAREGARAIAERAGVRRIAPDAVAALDEPGRTLYRFDVRTAQEYQRGHLPGFRHAPGGQLVQETDHHAPVRGARIVLADDDGVRADMAASWLAQMGWEVWVVEPTGADARTAGGPASDAIPEAPSVQTVTPARLQAWCGDKEEDRPVILDVGPGVSYLARHVPGAWYAIRSQLAQALARVPGSRRYVLTCGTGLLARFAAQDLRELTDAEVWVLEGGTTAWMDAGLPVETGESRLAVPRTDRYRRPYEGTDNAAAAMQAYLDWEFGLIAQIERDGTHNFRVV